MITGTMAMLVFWGKWWLWWQDTILMWQLTERWIWIGNKVILGLLGAM